MRNRPRLVALVLPLLLPSVQGSDKLALDLTWNGDYKQLYHRLQQAYRLSQRAAEHGQVLYGKALVQGRELYGRYKEARYDHEFRHLYPYLEDSSQAVTESATPPAPPEDEGLSLLSYNPEAPHRSVSNGPSQTFTRGGKLSRVEIRGGSDHGATLDEKFRIAVALGLVLAFNSGFINGCCLSGVTSAHKQAVAAVTSAYTNSALGLASGNFSQFATQIQVLLSYILGSALAGCLNPRPVALDFSSARQPALLVAGALLSLSSYLAVHAKESGSYAYFLLAAMANGLQNSVTSSATANLCRTTHYTGMSSDIGTFVGQAVRGNASSASRLKVFCGLAAAFWTGGVVSYFAIHRYGGWSLLLGAAVYFFVGSGALQKLFLTPNVDPIYATSTLQTKMMEAPHPVPASTVESMPLAAASVQGRQSLGGGLQSLAM
jgi:hypothetical protein